MIIPKKCSVCKKLIWWWDKKEYFEITPDFRKTVHLNCFSMENYKKEMDKWFFQTQGFEEILTVD